MSDISKGLYNKYKIINNDTGLESDDKCFILKPDSDIAARSALRAYATITENKELAKGLLHWANHKFVPCGCREAFCGHLFGMTKVERNEADPLITTIESQKEEIERLQKSALSLAYRVLKKKYEEDAESYIEHIFKIESEIESLKAITEQKNAEIERLRKFLMDFRERTPYGMYVEMIDGVLMSNE